MKNHDNFLYSKRQKLNLKTQDDVGKKIEIRNCRNSKHLMFNTFMREVLFFLSTV